MRRENRKKESHLLVEQIIKEELTAEQLQNQAADSDDDGKYPGGKSLPILISWFSNNLYK